MHLASVEWAGPLRSNDAAVHIHRAPHAPESTTRRQAADAASTLRWRGRSVLGGPKTQDARRMTSSMTFGSADNVSFGPAPTSMAEAHARIRDLEAALTTRHVIGVAQGILMERRRLPLESAFDAVRLVSQNTNLGGASARP